MNPKIVGFEELSDRCKKLRDAGKKLVATNGCFDLLHVGHVRYLQGAAAEADRLIVAINDDQSVGCLKGPNRPVMAAADRAELVAALGKRDCVGARPPKTASLP